MLQREVNIDLANFGTKELSNFEILGINKFEKEKVALIKNIDKSNNRMLQKNIDKIKNLRHIQIDSMIVEDIDPSPSPKSFYVKPKYN